MKFNLLNKVLLVIGFLVFSSDGALANLASYDWQAIPMQSGEVSNISVFPPNPDIMFLGVEVNAHSGYKSTDRGKTWKRITSYDHNKDILVHPTDVNTVLLADSQHVWRSTTGGEGNVRTGEGARGGPPESFSIVLKNDNDPGPSESSFSTLAYAPTNPNIWYTAVRGARSGRGGFGDGKAHLWKSTDVGESWGEIKGEIPNTILVLRVDPKNEMRVLAGSDEGIFESTNGGEIFKKIADVGPITDLTTLDGQTWLAASMSGVLRSTDAGQSWTENSNGLPSKSVLRVGLVRDAPNVAWATTYDGVAKSEDNGATWKDVSGNLPAKNLQALAVDPTNPHLAIVGTETFVFSVRSENYLFKQGQYFKQGLYRTEDGGKTWSRSDGGLIEENVLDVTAHPKRPHEVWASQQSSRGLYRSRDAGQSWSVTPHLLTHYPMRTVFFPGADDKLAHTSLHIGEDFGISEDSGVNWTIQSEDTFFSALNRGKSLLNSSKKGRANLHLHGVAIDPKNPEIIYVGSVDDPSQFNEKAVNGAHIFKSTDGGKTWNESDNGYDHEYATSINDIKIDPQNTSTIYIALTKKESTNGNGVWKSTDGGDKWFRSNSGMPDNASVATLVIHPQKPDQLLAATFEGLYRSADGGATWVRKKSGTFKDVEFNPANPNVVYTGSGPEGPSNEGKNGAFVSPDFGETWTDITGNLPSTKVTSMAVNSHGTIVYAGTEEKGLFVARDPSLAIGPDITTKTELGSSRGGDSRRQDEKRGEYAGAHKMNDCESSGDPAKARECYMTQGRGDEPPAWFKTVVLTASVGLISLVTILMIIYFRRRASPKKS